MNCPLADQPFPHDDLAPGAEAVGRSAGDGVWFGFDGVTFAIRATLLDR